MELETQKNPETFSSTVEVYSRDDRDLMRLGKKPVLKRNFGFMQILGFSCTVLVTWEGILHWVAMLAPRSYSKFLSFITGWVTLIGWQATTASSAYLGGTILQSTVLLVKSDYSPKPYQAMLLGWALLVFSVTINTVGSKTLAYFEGLILIIHVLGFFAIMVPLVYLSDHSDASIFTTFVNSGGWSTQALSFMVGLPSSVFALIGVDSCVHMAEEVKNATRVVPRVIQISVLLNGTLGLAMLVAYLFCLGNLDDVVESSATFGYAYLYVFLKGTGSAAGAAAMALIMWALGVCCLVSLMAATSRQLWSFARDNAVPFATQVTKGIDPYNERATVVGPETLRWGPWKVPGALGTANNLFACVYLIVMWFFSFWPASVKVNAESMNFSSVTFGGTVLLAMLWYFIYGRKTYVGPTVEVEL
ncbi:uncharacterized protein SETTUDRAFT_153825 [Exserohilum turcica Et28A]|uniref:GABA permease n=1 Tax=Exserohilum turcicum (strain 28A) TaxID=671987 RepID=R0IQ76_EXST2|nr:uncharacterized protein SETTUDRAFT_153825 [Exserohilum turcica Et28A]EOA87065.1 hypothetical protein SETTUDRAFT_153825 [Exserohilum turcica Et28A]